MHRPKTCGITVFVAVSRGKRLCLSLDAVANLGISVV